MVFSFECTKTFFPVLHFSNIILTMKQYLRVGIYRSNHVEHLGCLQLDSIMIKSHWLLSQMAWIQVLALPLTLLP